MTRVTAVNGRLAFDLLHPLLIGGPQSSAERFRAAEYEVLVAPARVKMAGGQHELDLGLESEYAGALEITSTRMAALDDAICQIYTNLGIEEPAGGDA